MTHSFQAPWRALRPFLLALAFMSAMHAPGLSQSVQETRAQLETYRLELNQIEAALQRGNLDDSRLGELRGRIDPVVNGTGDTIAREQPRADDIKARLEKLGPPPDVAKGQSESAEVAQERADLQKAWRDVDETLRLVRAIALRAEQLQQAIADRRREIFTRQILEQNASILSPLLWLDVAHALPRDIRAFQTLATQWAAAVIERLGWLKIGVLVVLAGALWLGWPRLREWGRTGHFAKMSEPGDPDWEPTRLKKILVALRMLVLNAIAPAAACLAIYALLDVFGFLPGRVDAIMRTILMGAGYYVFISGLSGSILAPYRPTWRLAALSDASAIELWRLVRIVTALIAIGKVLDAINRAIVSALPTTIATKGVVALLVAYVLAHGIHRAFRAKTDDSVLSAAAPASPPARLANLLPFRLAAWGAIIAILGAVAFGYTALASFLIYQVVWVFSLGLIMLLLLALIEEGVGVGLSARGILGRRVREATGLAASSLDQASVLGAGLARLLVFIALGLLALAPWGVDSSDLLGNIRAAFFGFQMGGVTISLSTIAIGIGLFAIGALITRAIRNWLDMRYLPQTGLDPGLRNSIGTIFSYIGVFLAAILALSHLGLSLEKITLVAGALSVGIGFGLQSIVNNFVSGLILLWERPIRVGDWIVVGDEQGTVKRINVRATEIETFDRASLIIPNSEFISGRVKNWMHSDRMARIIIPVNVEYEADPAMVQALLQDAALNHREVLSEPKPNVIFKNLGESGLDFELRCFVDVDAMAPTRSELLFDIFRRLKEAGIAIPYPTRRLEITNMPNFEPPEPRKGTRRDKSGDKA